MGKVHKMPACTGISMFDSPEETFANLWALDIGEVTGHNLEVRGREEVNRLLGEGWLLLHIYTLTYNEDGTWRERPMAILGRPRSAKPVRSAASPNKTSRKAAPSDNTSLATLLSSEDLPHTPSHDEPKD